MIPNSLFLIHYSESFIIFSFRGRLMVGHDPLEVGILVRVQTPEKSHSN